MAGTDTAQVVEAVSAAAIPIAGALAAAVRWRKSAQNSRAAREEAARISGENAARDARAEVQTEKARTDAATERLIAEKDRQIAALQQNLVEERRENSEKDILIRELMQGRPSGG